MVEVTNVHTSIFQSKNKHYFIKFAAVYLLLRITCVRTFINATLNHSSNKIMSVVRVW